jgi:hypothetical protein
MVVSSNARVSTILLMRSFVRHKNRVLRLERWNSDDIVLVESLVILHDDRLNLLTHYWVDRILALER